MVYQSEMRQTWNAQINDLKCPDQIPAKEQLKGGVVYSGSRSEGCNLPQW